MDMNKNYFHFSRSIFYSSIALFFIITSTSAEDTYSSATIELLARDSVMEEITMELESIDNLNSTESVLLKWLKAYPEFEYLIRINSKGKIISKVADNKILPRDFRYIGNQKWYKAVELLEKPYYGNVIQNKG
ncbi:MAG: hypothetical protein PVI26_09700, partial [Chitinispirillia bacterium]